VPLTSRMFVYTFVRRSILSEPIIERTSPAQPTAVVPEPVAIPAEALLPEPGTGRLRPVGPGRTARQMLTYRMLGSAFHDGSAMTAADIFYAVMFAYRWGVRGAADGHYDPTVDSATVVLRQRLLGLRL